MGIYNSFKDKTHGSTWSVLVTLLFAVLACPVRGQVVSRPDLFKIEKFATFSLPPLADFGLLISDGSRGFPTGLLVSTGPTTDRNNLLFISPSGQVSVFKDGFTSNEGLTFARGAYGAGALVSEIADGKIVRLLPDKSTSVFSSGFTQPNVGFGPAQIAYGPDPNGILPEVLYATDYTSGNIMRVNPDGTTSVFAAVAAHSKGISAVTASYGGGFIVSTFNRNTDPFTGQIFHVSADGSSVTQMTQGVTGLQLLATGDSQAFPGTLHNSITDLIDGKIFVPSIGLGPSDDGNVSILNPDGTLSPFISNIDASSVVFDSNYALGGGMFVTDVDRDNGEETIYRVTAVSAVPEPSIWVMNGLGFVGLIAFTRVRSRRLDIH